MKFIHCADVHLGSKLLSRFPEEKARVIRSGVRLAFNKMIDYANGHGIAHILLAGDVFDKDRPFGTDKQFFYETVRRNKNITFYYLCGNHDREAADTDKPENLKTFTNTWTICRFGDITLWGLESDGGNSQSMYSALRPEKDTKNVVMLHGTAGESTGEGLINLNKLKNKNIDYLALGHIHKPSVNKLDERGVYAYSGCLAGRGFDERGEKGFFVVDSNDFKNPVFVPCAGIVIREESVDVSDCANTVAAIAKIKRQVKCGERDIVRLIIKGEISFDADVLKDDALSALGGCFFADVVIATVRRIDCSEYENSLSLAGEFVRTVQADGNLTEEERQKILNLGLKALRGRAL